MGSGIHAGNGFRGFQCFLQKPRRPKTGINPISCSILLTDVREKARIVKRRKSERLPTDWSKVQSQQRVDRLPARRCRGISQRIRIQRGQVDCSTTLQTLRKTALEVDIIRTCPTMIVQTNSVPIHAYVAKKAPAKGETQMIFTSSIVCLRRHCSLATDSRLEFLVIQQP